MAPAMVRFPTPVYHLGRWFFGLAGSVVTMAILLLGFDTAPVHKKIFGVIDYKHKPPFGLGLDHEWLGFFQYTTGQVFASYGSATRDPFGEYGDAQGLRPAGRVAPAPPGSAALWRRVDPRRRGGRTAAGAAAGAPASRRDVPTGGTVPESTPGSPCRPGGVASRP